MNVIIAALLLAAHPGHEHPPHIGRAAQEASTSSSFERETDEVRALAATPAFSEPTRAQVPAKEETPEALALAAAKSIERSYQHVVHVIGVGVDHDKYDKHRLLQIAFWSRYARDRVREASNATAALSPDRHVLNVKANQAIGTLFQHAAIRDMLHIIEPMPKRGAATSHSHRR